MTPAIELPLEDHGRSALETVVKIVPRSQRKRKFSVDKKGKGKAACRDLRTSIIVSLLVIFEEIFSEVCPELQSVIENQGQGCVFAKSECMDDSLVKEFYSCLEVEEKGGTIVGSFVVKGEKYNFNPDMISRTMKIPFEELGKVAHGVWPLNTKDLMRMIFGDANRDVKSISRNDLRLLSKLVHQVVCRGVHPRIE